MAAGGDPGGILGLLELIEEHRGAIEYDFRTRLHTPLASLPEAMGWDEAIRLIAILRRDPSSMIAAALEGWDHPVSREALILMDLFDLDMSINTDRKKGKPKPHPGRPFKVDGGKRERIGKAAARADVAAILNAHGHALPV